MELLFNLDILEINIEPINKHWTVLLNSIDNGAVVVTSATAAAPLSVRTIPLTGTVISS